MNVDISELTTNSNKSNKIFSLSPPTKTKAPADVLELRSHELEEAGYSCLADSSDAADSARYIGSKASPERVSKVRPSILVSAGAIDVRKESVLADQPPLSAVDTTIQKKGCGRMQNKRLSFGFFASTKNRTSAKANLFNRTLFEKDATTTYSSLLSDRKHCYASNIKRLGLQVNRNRILIPRQRMICAKFISDVKIKSNITDFREHRLYSLNLEKKMASTVNNCKCSIKEDRNQYCEVRKSNYSKHTSYFFRKINNSRFKINFQMGRQVSVKMIKKPIKKICQSRRISLMLMEWKNNLKHIKCSKNKKITVKNEVLEFVSKCQEDALFPNILLDADSAKNVSTSNNVSGLLFGAMPSLCHSPNIKRVKAEPSECAVELSLSTDDLAMTTLSKSVPSVLISREVSTGNAKKMVKIHDTSYLARASTSDPKVSIKTECARSTTANCGSIESSLRYVIENNNGICQNVSQESADNDQSYSNEATTENVALGQKKTSGKSSTASAVTVAAISDRKELPFTPNDPTCRVKLESSTLSLASRSDITTDDLPKRKAKIGLETELEHLDKKSLEIKLSCSPCSIKMDKYRKYRDTEITFNNEEKNVQVSYSDEDSSKKLSNCHSKSELWHHLGQRKVKRSNALKSPHSLQNSYTLDTIHAPISQKDSSNTSDKYVHCGSDSNHENDAIPKVSCKYAKDISSSKTSNNVLSNIAGRDQKESSHSSDKHAYCRSDCNHDDDVSKVSREYAKDMTLCSRSSPASHKNLSNTSTSCNMTTAALEDKATSLENRDICKSKTSKCVTVGSLASGVRISATINYRSSGPAAVPYKTLFVKTVKLNDSKAYTTAESLSKHDMFVSLNISNSNLTNYRNEILVQLLNEQHDLQKRYLALENQIKSMETCARERPVKNIINNISINPIKSLEKCKRKRTAKNIVNNISITFPNLATNFLMSLGNKKAKTSKSASSNIPGQKRGNHKDEKKDLIAGGAHGDKRLNPIAGVAHGDKRLNPIAGGAHRDKQLNPIDSAHGDKRLNLIAGGAHGNKRLNLIAGGAHGDKQLNLIDGGAHGNKRLNPINGGAHGDKRLNLIAGGAHGDKRLNPIAGIAHGSKRLNPIAGGAHGNKRLNPIAGGAYGATRQRTPAIPRTSNFYKRRKLCTTCKYQSK